MYLFIIKTIYSNSSSFAITENNIQQIERKLFCYELFTYY